MSNPQLGSIITLTLFVAGLIYHAGRLSVRVEVLERELRELVRSSAAQMEVFRKDIEELKDMLRAAVGERRNWRTPH
jgi:hypothetical protein